MARRGEVVSFGGSRRLDELSSVWLLRFMVDFYQGVKWTLESAFKPYPKGGQDCEAIPLAIGGSDRSGLRRRGVLGSISGWYSLACRGQHRYIQFTAFCYLGVGVF
ncbi:hypothetical protein IGI04_034083 [Brassica rapa subsp. trilocularis]|uniref:Uncharacterized protein n=1 Tax=Brassica rapa subsp. trilocularis TaxID=1813537 RepID=A0ABQ7L7R8_BRACM|nr:hypothetical protein IGI04_034083 [Brassica rapa subsp. trilocularis]